MELLVDIEGETARPKLPRGGADLVAFMSFAAMRGFGAQHPLIALADHMQHAHQVRLGPLTTFYEGKVDDAEDEEKLNMTWQPAAELLESLEHLLEPLASHDDCKALLERARASGLPEQISALVDSIRVAAVESKRVRLSYEL